MKRPRLILPLDQYKVLCKTVMRRDGWKCRACKRRQTLHCHHIVFRSHGGDDAEWNMVTLCDNCHNAVHYRWCIVKPVPEDLKHIDANKQLQFECINGWTPGKRMEWKMA